MRPELKIGIIFGVVAIAIGTIWAIQSNRSKKDAELPFDNTKTAAATKKTGAELTGSRAPAAQPTRPDPSPVGSRPRETAATPPRTTPEDRPRQSSDVTLPRTAGADPGSRLESTPGGGTDSSTTPTRGDAPVTRTDLGAGSPGTLTRPDGARGDAPVSPGGARSTPVDATKTEPPRSGTTGSSTGTGSQSPAGAQSTTGSQPPALGGPATETRTGGSREVATPLNQPNTGGSTPGTRSPTETGRSGITTPPRSSESSSPTGRNAATADDTYTIQAGDTLAAIAREKLGSEGLWTAIVSANPGIEPTHLKVGQKIKLPARDAAARPNGQPSAPASGAPGSGAAGGSGSRTSVDGSPTKPPGESASPPERVVRPADRQPAAGGEYTVQKGDTLNSIAQKVLKDGGRWSEIFALNRDKLASPDRVREGMVLKMPAPESKPGSARP